MIPRAEWDRIVDGDWVRLRDDGTLVYESIINASPDDLNSLLAICGDNAVDGVDGELVDWHAAERDAREAGLIPPELR